MKLNCLNYLFLITLFSFIACASGDNDEDSWMDPDAWARDYLSSNSLQSLTGKCCKCSEDDAGSDRVKKSEAVVQKSSEDAASIIYLKKFITMLFNRKYLKYESTLGIYERTLAFTIDSSQLDELEKLNDPRDLDIILTKIFEKARIPKMDCDGQPHHTVSSGFMSSTLQLLYKMLQLTKMSEIRFLLIATAVILIAYVIHNRLNVGLFTLICGGIFLYGYLHTYLECNREIEVNQMLEIIKQSKGEQEINQESRFIRFLKNLFSSNETPQDLERLRLKNSAKLSLGFCRPDHVLIMYFNDIFLKYLQVLLEQCTSTLTTLNGSLSFPYNIISGVLLICMIGYILKLTFKYILSPSSWVHFVHKSSNGPQLASLPNNQNSCNEDRISVSGDNLKLLLNAFNAQNYQNSVPITAVSGVEEVKEAIENCQSAPTTDKDNISNNVENNNSKRDLLDENPNPDVTLEDLPDKSEPIIFD